MASLHGHFGRLYASTGRMFVMRWRSPTFRDQRFPSQEGAADQSPHGPGRGARAIRLIAAADLDFRGRSAWPPEFGG
ncbi:MAG: hypothetical protein Ct9H300mP12_00510 [Acidimicrobiales bacterium]|nr:MAG: hypothetical protein Ct9H300mP12_00510 [Acidimicrobiales bacterium]